MSEWSSVGNMKDSDREVSEEYEQYEEDCDDISPKAAKGLKIGWALITVFCIIGILCLGGKLYSEVRKQQTGHKAGKAYLDKMTKQAKNYYEDKYHKEAVVTENGYLRVQGMSEEELSDIYVVLEGGTTVIYREDKKQFLDDEQAGVIEDKINENVLKNLLHEAVKESGFMAQDIIVERGETNLFGVGTNIAGHFFHDYYEGEVMEYLKNEPVTLTGVQVYILCEKNAERELMIACLQDKMREAFLGFTDSEIEICFLSENCYQQYLDQQYRKPDVGMEECYASYVMGKQEKTYIQHYIKVADGIYVTSAESNLILEEKDIVLEKENEVSDKQINELLLNNHQKKYREKGKAAVAYSQMIVRTPVYRIRYSERIESYLQQKTYHEIAVYIKFVPEEAGIEKPLKQEIDDEIVKLSETTQAVRERLETIMETGKEAADDDKKELWQRCRLYYFNPEKDDRCKDLAADLSDAERLIIKEGLTTDCFGGYEILCRDIENN